MNRGIFLLTLFAVSVCLCFYRLGSRQYSRWDELTNRNVVWEFVVRPTYPGLTHHGSPFFEKPPLWFWLSAGSAYLLGLDSASLRLVSALSGILTIAAVWLFAKTYVSRQAALLSVLVLVSTSQLFLTDAGGFFSTHTFRSADPDGLFVFLFTASVLLLTAVRKGLSAALFPGSAASALAVLTKGPLGLLPFLVLFAPVASAPRVSAQRNIAALALAVFLILPWHIHMFRSYGNRFVETYVGYHILDRFVEPLEGHANPVWYYARVFSSPGVFAAAPLLLGSVALFLHGRHARTRPELSLPLVCLAVLVLVIGAARTRLAWYLLPMYPISSIICGWGLWQARMKRNVVFPISVLYLSLMMIGNLASVIVSG